MTVLSRRALVYATTALGAGALALLTGCGVGAEGGPASSASTTAPTPSATGPAPQTAATTATWTVPAPRSLTGASWAEEVGDIEPVTTTPAPVVTPVRRPR